MVNFPWKCQEPWLHERVDRSSSIDRCLPTQESTRISKIASNSLLSRRQWWLKKKTWSSYQITAPNGDIYAVLSMQIIGSRIQQELPLLTWERLKSGRWKPSRISGNPLTLKGLKWTERNWWMMPNCCCSPLSQVAPSTLPQLWKKKNQNLIFLGSWTRTKVKPKPSSKSWNSRNCCRGSFSKVLPNDYWEQSFLPLLDLASWPPSGSQALAKETKRGLILNENQK